MHIDLLIQRLKELKKEGADRVYIDSPDFYHKTPIQASSVYRDREGDAVIS